MNLLKLLLLFLLQLEQTQVDGYNYCHNKKIYCEETGLKHFICNMNEELKPYMGTAKLVGLVPDTQHARNKFLEYHNVFRNRLAGGELVTSGNNTFKEAARMREVIWDLELAYFARLHVSTVSFKHTECRGTSRFPYVGENLGMVMPGVKKKTLIEVLDMSLTPMLEEYLQIKDPADVVSSFNCATDTDYGHFTVVASDRVSRLGCAIAVATGCSGDSESGYCYFLACYYDFTNLEDNYIYESGDKASNCDCWKSSVSKEYPNLCTNNGKIFPKNHDNHIWQ